MNITPLSQFRDRELRAVLAEAPEREVIALVHAKLLTLRQRSDFENARRNLSRKELGALAAETLARQATPASRRG